MNQQLMWVYYDPASRGRFTPKLDGNEIAAAFAADSAAPLGTGAFGETWRIDVDGQPSRAVKVILDENYPRDRVGREVEGLMRASSPHVVDLVETRDIALSQGTRACLVFEFIEGGDLGGQLASGVAPTHSEVWAFARGLLAGVAELHQASTLHRDIKPENIALRGTQWSAPVLLDLGLAKVLDQDSLTAYPMLLGTAPFMAPEQLRGERARKAADVFAVGTVLHLLLTGRHPFYGPWTDRVDQDGALKRINAGPPALPVSVPAGLADVVGRLLSPQPHMRGSATRALGDLNASNDDTAGGQP